MFDWLLYTDGILKEKYLNVNQEEKDLYCIKQGFYLQYKNNSCFLVKEEEEYKIKLDFINKQGKISLIKENVDTEFELYEVSIKEDNNKIFIEYKLDDSNNKIIINRKDN